MHHEADKEWIEKGLKTNIIYLSEADFDFMVEMINNPPEPNEFLKKLLEEKRSQDV